MIGDDGGTWSIDVRESRLRVLAGCAATIIAGWAVHAGVQAAGATGGRAIVWGAAGFWSAILWIRPIVGRALGRQRGRFIWVQSAGFLLYLPFLSLVGRVAPRAVSSHPLLKRVFEIDDGHFPLAVASAIALVVVAAVGFVMEKPRRMSSWR